MNPIEIKKLTDEEILSLRIQYDFLCELERILASKNEINKTIIERQVIQINGQTANLEALENQGIFADNGNLAVALPSNIIIDHRASVTNRELPKREQIIFDGVNFAAAAVVGEKYKLSYDYLSKLDAMYPSLNNYYRKPSYTKMADEIPGRIMSRQNSREIPLKKLGILHMESPKSYTLDSNDKQKIANLKKEYELQFLLDRVAALKSDYKKLGRSKHVEKINNLIKDINLIKAKNIPAEEKIQKILQLLEAQFIERMHASNYLSLFSSGNKSKKFIDSLNRNSNDYQFPRLLAVILKNSYRDNPTLGNPELQKALEKFSISNSQHRRVYHTKIADTTNDYNYPEFHAALKQTGLDNQQILDLYKQKNEINTDLLKQLWPNLTALGIEDSSLKEIIECDDIKFPGIIANIINNLDEDNLQKLADAESMHATLDEISGQSKRLTKTERKNVHDDIDKKFSKVNLQEQLIAIKAALYIIKGRNEILSPPELRPLGPRT